MEFFTSQNKRRLYYVYVYVPVLFPLYIYVVGTQSYHLVYARPLSP